MQGSNKYTLSTNELNNITATANADGTGTSFSIEGQSGLNNELSSTTVVTNNNNEFFLTITLDTPQYLNRIVMDSSGDSDGFQIYTIFLGKTEDSSNFETLIDVTSDAGNGNVEYPINQPNPDPIKYKTVQIKFTKTTGEGALGFDNSTSMRIDHITLYTINASEYSKKDYNIEFDDSLLDMASWNNARYNGSKLQGSQINKFVEGDPIYGAIGQKPIIENKVSALFIGNSIQDGGIATSSLDPLVEIKNHSYVTIDAVLLINIETKEVTKISHEQFNESEDKKESFRRLIADSFPEGSEIVTKILDIATPTQLKESHYVKLNQGLLMKLYSYTANGDGHEDGVFGGFGLRDQKGILTNNMASGSTPGGGLFGFGMTAVVSHSLFTSESITTISELPSELSLYGTTADIITSLNPITASNAPDSTLPYENLPEYRLGG